MQDKSKPPNPARSAKPASIADVARAAGVSIATVSRIVNGTTGKASAATVARAGVTAVHDSYSVIFSACGGALYYNCSLCDNEAAYACPAYRALGGFCGYHYVAPGWELLANSTAAAIRGALAQRRAAAPLPPA